MESILIFIIGLLSLVLSIILAIYVWKNKGRSNKEVSVIIAAAFSGAYLIGAVCIMVYLYR